jgi:hypothetical protein
VLPQASVASHVRVAVKVSPQSAFVTVLTMLMPFVPQASVAVGSSKVHTAPVSTSLLLLQVMAGAVVSATVTVCEH